MTSDYLLEGACLALEQCGRLLSDAVILYEKNSHSSALGLAALASEELGKCKLYRDLERDLQTGKTLSLKDIKEATEDHVVKHKAAISGVTYGGDSSTVIGKAISQMITSNVTSDNFRKAKAVADAAGKTKAKRLPDDRHQRRNRALYVDPADGNRWLSPKDITQDEARMYIIDVANDYANHKGNLELRQEDASVNAYLKANEKDFCILAPSRPSLLKPG
jgi:AbiV family abortive infection protein